MPDQPLRWSERAADLTELMDDPDCDLDQLRRTLRRFGLVNRLVSCWDTVYRSQLRPVLARLDRPSRILDIGCGAGDVLRRLVRLARRDGFAVAGVGIDPDSRALEVAHRADPLPGVFFRPASSQTLMQDGTQYDIVVSNHLLHHLDDRELDGLIADSEALASHLCLHSDIARSRLAYHAYSLGILPLAPGSFLRIDGLRSIRRSYTPAELAARLPPTWQVERPGAFRLLAVHRASRPSAR